jgi:prevent-host-death family protein
VTGGRSSGREEPSGINGTARSGVRVEPRFKLRGQAEPFRISRSYSGKYPFCAGMACALAGVSTRQACLTRDTFRSMAEVTIRELRNRGGEVVDRVAAGERVIVTRSGKPVAELRPVRVTLTTAAALLARWRRLPPLDIAALRADLDSVINPTL